MIDDVTMLRALLAEQIDRADAAERERDAARGLVASSADAINTHLRDLGCDGSQVKDLEGFGLRDAISFIHGETNSRLFKAERERDAVVNLLVQPGATAEPTWDVLIPDKFSPLGFSWEQDHENRDAALAKLMQAATATPPEPGQPGQ
jgi:hypothetical protein